jgi:SagB-type dehydrogenase family enzyme
MRFRSLRRPDVTVVILFLVSTLFYQARSCDAMDKPILPGTIVLAPAATESSFSVETALQSRRSVRSYAQDPLTLAEIGQLLWAAQGQTSPRGFRTAPSAGALYPLELFIVAGKVDDLAPGVYRYRPSTHTLTATATGDLREDVSRAALNQRFFAEAPALMVISAVYERTTAKYSDRGMRYVLMEAGHAAQNVYLQAAALGLGTLVVGAFRDEQIQALLNCADDEQPLYLMPIGKPRP